MPLPNLIRDEVCPFCGENLNGQAAAITLHHPQSMAEVRCPICGRYEITGEAVDLLPRWTLSEGQRAGLAFAIRRMTDRPDPPRLTREIVLALKDTATVPRPEGLLDEAVLWFGNHSEHVGKMFSLGYGYRSILGAWNVAAFNFVAEWMLESRLFAGQPMRFGGGMPVSVVDCQLTAAGWQRYAELAESRAASNYGFMAMNYGDAELDAIVRDHFAPEIRRTGFELRRLDEGQPAGLIDDQLRVAIRTARFVVCDLTHGNRGAYWEAGFAEGLGRPVIYTCRRDVFEDRQNPNHPHFDTNHMVTVVWDRADPPSAARRLKDTIRATLPAEARLTD